MRRSSASTARYRSCALSHSDHLAPVIDSVGIAVISPQRSKIRDLAVLPKDTTTVRNSRQRIDYTIFRDTNDLPVHIDREGTAAVLVRRGKRTHVGYETLLPFKGVDHEWDETADEEEVLCPDKFRL
jgi:hypothetical protein